MVRRTSAIAASNVDSALAPYRSTQLTYVAIAALVSLMLAGVAVFGAISQIRQSVQRRHQSQVQATFRLAVDGAREAFYMIRPIEGDSDEWLLEDCNERAAALLGLLRSHLTGRRASDAMPDNSRVELVAICSKALATGVYFFWRQHNGRLWLALGAVATGLCIAAGWGLTQAVANQSFEPVALTSLSFSGPSAEWLMRVLSSASVPGFGFDAGLLPATFVGSLIGALVGGDFKFEGFKTENKLGHYLTGAILMGFGAVLAGGCTVGAGMSGGAIFAMTAWLTLISIWLGAAATLRLHKARGWAV